MKITCALSNSQIEGLYTYVYGTLYKANLVKKTSTEPVEDFNIESFLRDLFKTLSEKKDPETAAKFLQQVPALIFLAKANPKIKGLKFDFNKVDDLLTSFTDEENGIINTLKYFNPELSPEDVQNLVQQQKKDSQKIKLTEPSEEETTDDARLKPYSIFSGTYQEFYTLDPKLKNFLTVEEADESKVRMYSILNNIKKEFTGDESLLTGLEYKGKKLGLKAVQLINIEREQRDTYTDKLIGKAAGIMAKGTHNPELAKVNQIIALVLSDNEGNELYFDQNNELTTKDKGKIIYQLIRNITFNQGVYTVPNVYGKGSQIMSPERIAQLDNITVKEAFDNQQKEFKEVFDFKNQVLKEKTGLLITLTGISPGVSENVTTKKTSLQKLASLPFTQKEILGIYGSIKPVTETTENLEAGWSTIVINNQTFVIDRPLITEELTNKIAAVFLNPNIPNKEKIAYVEQFLNNNVVDSVKRHTIAYNPTTGILTFKYTNETTAEIKETGIATDNFIPLNDLSTISKAEYDKRFETIKDILFRNAHSYKDKSGVVHRNRTRVILNQANVQSMTYRDYDLVTNDFLDSLANYADFLTKMNPNIQLNSETDPSFFNAYMSFKVPDEITKEINSALKKQKLSTQTLNFLEKRALAVKALQEKKSVKGTIIKKTDYTKHGFITKNGTEFSFFAKYNNITPEDYNAEAYLELEPDIEINGELFKDPVAVKIGDKTIGYLQATAFSKNDKLSIQKTNKEVVAETLEITQPTDVAQPDDLSEDDLADRMILDRKTYLDNNVTKEQLDIADAWVKESPLFSDKNGPSVQHVANIVNSDVYAQFVVAGKTLSDVKVLVNAATRGNMADVYHEAWHTFSQLYLTKKQKVKLYNNVRNSKPEYKNLSFLELEEIIAEEFRDYALTGATDKKAPVKESMFKSILNWIKKFLGITNVDGKDVLFQKLYFAGKNPKLLNNYTPLIDNVMFDILNRGIQQVNNKKEDCLNRQDSNALSNSIDSIISEVIDDLNARESKKRVSAGGIETKSGTIQFLLNPDNKDLVYSIVKTRLEKKLTYWKDKLGPITSKSFNELDTVDSLKKNAIAVIKSKDGVNKYVFLNSQVDVFDNLNLSIKDGDRLKGQTFEGVDIVADYYDHKSLLNEKGEPQEIIVVDKIQDAEIQYDNYIKSGLVGETFTGINQPNIKILSSEEQSILNKIRILQIGISNWGDISNGLVRYHIENSNYDIVRQQYVEIEDDTDIDTSNRGGIGKVNPEDVTLEQGASKETIYILKSLFKINKQGQHTEDILGFKERVEFKKTWFDIVNTVGGIKDAQEQYDALIGAISIYPEFAQLVNSKIPNPEFANTLYETRINSAFVRDLGRKTKYDYIQNTMMEDSHVEVVVASIGAPQLISKYEDLFKTDISNPYVNRSYDNINKLDLIKILTAFKSSNKYILDESKALDFARAIGLYIDDIDVIQEKLTESHGAITYFGLGHIYQIIRQISEKEREGNNSKEVLNIIEDFKLNPIGTLKKGIPENTISTKAFGERTQLLRIVDLQIKYGSEITSLSTLNAKGDTVNPFINDHSISMMVYGINKAEKLSDLWLKPEIQYMSYLDPEINTFTNRSAILKTIFNFTSSIQEKRPDQDLQVFISSGSQTIDEDGVNTTNLDIFSKNLQEVNGLLKGGIQEFMRHASKSQAFGIKIKGQIFDGQGGKKKDPKLWVDIDKFAMGSEGADYAFNQHIIQYIAAEVDRINKFNSNIDLFKTYKGYNRVVGKTKEGKDIYAGQSFNGFDNVLREKTKIDILDNVKSGQDLVAYLKTNPELKAKIVKDVSDYFEEQTEQNHNFLKKSPFISPDLISNLNVFNLSPTEAVKVLMKAYTYNAWIHHYETATLFYGDLAQYDDIHKRNTGASSVGEGYRTDAAMLKFINDPNGPVRKNTYAASFPIDEGYDNFEYNGTLNTAIVQDVIRTSEYLDDYIRPALHKYYTEQFKNVNKEILTYNLSKEGLKDLIKLHGKNFTLEQVRKAMVEDRVAIESAPYEKMEESDGQGFITFDAYRMLKLSENNWTDPQEALFRKIVSGKEIESDEISEAFPVYKVQNFGHLANTELPVNAMHKFSLMPLIPGVFKKGSDLDSLHNQMMKEQIHYMTFGSGSKVGSILAPNGKHDEIYEEGSNNKTIKKDIKFTKNVIYLEYLKNVTTMSSVFKGKVIYSSQARGIGIDGLFEQGKIINLDNQQAYDNYLNGVDDLRNIIEIGLLFEIGYEKIKNKDGSYSYKGDLKKFMNLVQKELVRNDVPDHLIKFISVTPDNTLKFDLSFHPNADSIEKLIVSLIEKRVVKQKVKGEGFIQVSSAVTNGIWDKELIDRGGSVKEVQKFIGSNNLPFYYPGEDGKTVAMKVAIAMQGDFKNLFNLKYNGKLIGDIDTLNIAIKDPAWVEIHRSEITLNSVRIPVDAISSMEFAEVYHFLSPAAGPIIILPSEIVAKSGTDFDGDKMTSSLPNLTKQGEFITTDKTNEEIYEKALLLKAQGENQKGLSLIKQQQKAIENRLISASRGLLELEDNYVHLVRPNSMYLLKTIADDIRPFVTDYDNIKNMHGESDRLDKNGNPALSPTRRFEARFNLEKHEVNLISKKALGPTAIDNKLSPILNSIPAKLPKSYKLLTKWDDDLKKYIPQSKDRDLPTRVFLPHNIMIVNGVKRISLSNVNSADNMSTISNLYSHLMNGYLDVEKDAWVAAIQGNQEISPMISHLFEIGVPKEYVTMFLLQPLIRKYAEEQRLIDSAYAKYTGKGIEEAHFKKNKAASNVIESVIPQLVSNAIDKSSKDVTVTYYKNDINEYGEEVSTLTVLDTDKVTLKEMINNDEIFELDILKITNGPVPVYVKPDISNKKYYDTVSHYTSIPGVLNKEGYFKLEDLITNIKAPDLGSLDVSVAAFLHFLELEKQVKGTQDIKRAANIDTKTSKTIQELVKVNVNRKKLSENSKLDSETLDQLFNKSILRSFADNQIIIDLITPLFSIRNHPFVTDFITDVLDKRSGEIAKSFGSDKDSQVKFITSFKNAISNYIYQNHASDIRKSDGTRLTFDEMTTDNIVSFTNELFNVLNTYPLLKEKYLILNQITPTSIKKNKKTNVKQKSITLNDSRDVKGQLAEVYYQNLKELGNPSVRKVDNDDENTYISTLFKMLPQVSIYLNGQGYSKYGFSAALPFDEYMLAMQKVSNDFIANEMNNDTFEFIFNRLLQDTHVFKNYNRADVVQLSPVIVNPEDNLPAQYSLFDTINPDGSITHNLSFTKLTANKFDKKNIFKVTPQEGIADFKATAKASIATQYIGFGKDIVGKDGKRSSTQIYREQAGQYANTGAYSSTDVIFVSIPGRRGNATIAKREQDKTIEEAIKALEAGATLLTDNKAYTFDPAKTYNTGERNLYTTLESLGYYYDEIMVNAQSIGTWSKSTQPSTSVEVIPLSKSQRFTRESVKKDTDYLYLFTDNAGRSSGSNLISDESRYSAIYGQGKKYPGMTQAVIRGLDNAFPITTMVDDKRTQWTDDKFEQFKEEIDTEIEIISNNLKAFKGIKFSAEMPFGKGQISDMKNTAPKIWNYLNTKLAEIGIDNTGNIPVSTQLSSSTLTKREELEKDIKTLPIEIFNSIEVIDNVSNDLLDNKDILFAMKDVFEEVDIVDPLLVNWAGINKSLIGHPRNIRSTGQLERLIEKVYTEKGLESKYVEFKVNPLALESFKAWKKALKDFPLVFQDIMLTHAIKHITNPQRRSKYVLQLSSVALTNTYGILVNKPHEANRLGKLYDQEVLATISDSVEHEASESGKGYWVHIPRTESNNLGFETYELFKKHIDSRISETEANIKKLNDKKDPENNKKLTKELTDLADKEIVFTTQEPNLDRKTANEYGFEDFVHVRVESTMGRDYDGIYSTDGVYSFQKKANSETYTGYYIHGYNTSYNGTRTKLLPITKTEAEELWKKSSSFGQRTSEDEFKIRNLNTFLNDLNIETINRRIEEQQIDLDKYKEQDKTTSKELWDLEKLDIHKVNVDLLRKLSPSTWCTSGSMTEHYVENYDNYLLIVDGVTVAGIEASPNTNDNNKIQVKEVTSRANNGMAPIDHLEDVTAFFKKHNLDLDNNSIKKAIKAKESGNTDSDFGHDDYEDYNDYGDIYDDNDYYDFDDPDYARQEENERIELDVYSEIISEITTAEEVLNTLRDSPDTKILKYFYLLPQNIQDNQELAEKAVTLDPHNISKLSHNLPFYEELALTAMRVKPGVYHYLSDEAKVIPEIKRLYEENEYDLPFSKTNDNLIQGYYDPKTDKVVVVASNTPVNEGAKVAIHEVAHRGMLRMAKDLGGTKELGAALFAAEKQLMEKLPELLKRTGHKNLESLMLDYGFTTSSEEGKIKLLMELAARWAETLTDKVQPSWWKTFIESIQKWIANFTGRTLNEKEVNELVGGFVKYGTKNNSNTQSTTQTGTGSLNIESVVPESLLSVEELSKFKTEVDTLNGALPKRFFTEPIEKGLEKNMWILNINNLYDLVDPSNNEIYLQNVNLLTGIPEKIESKVTVVNESARKKAIYDLLTAVNTLKIDEVLSDKGYDYKEIVTNLENASSQEELNKIIAKLSNLLC